MKDKTIKIDLSKIANTALQEKVDKELEKVLENILDLNTEAKATRKVTITLTMSTDDERTVVKTGMSVLLLRQVWKSNLLWRHRKASQQLSLSVATTLVKSTLTSLKVVFRVRLTLMIMET